RRSARILNRALGRDLFDLSTPPALIQRRSVSREKPQHGAASTKHYTESLG
ncbi:lysine 6-monooxygenase, partial [Pantoea sp. SIMBA_133]